jgi:AraC-like DNA-binding protein
VSRKRQPHVCPPISATRYQVLALAYDFESGHVVPLHQHDWHQLVYASKGVMTIETPEGHWVVPPTRAVWVPGGTPHAVHVSGAASMRTLYLWPKLSRTLPRRCRVLGVSPLLRELVVHATERKTLCRRAKADRHLVEVILQQIESTPIEALHLPEPQDERAQRLVRCLRDDPADRRAIEDFDDVGASRRTLERVFRAETGMTVGKWRQQVRLLESLRRLASGAKVTAVALAVGYDSPSAFVAAFKRSFGTTPSRYFDPLAR